MDAADLALVRDLVRRTSGVLVADGAHGVESRLAPLARREGYRSVGLMIAAVRRRPDDVLATRIVETMTPIETCFFRDRTPFIRFRDEMLPHLARTRPPSSAIRIWSAGCAAGQEAYSLAMLVDEAALMLAGRRIEILATDLSARALAKARAGVYSQYEVQRGLPIRLLVKHFERAGEAWSVRPELKRNLSFRVKNLLEDFSGLGTFDVVFCRHVLELFAPEVRRDVAARLAEQTAKDGFLELGAGAATAAPRRPGVESAA